MEQLASDFSTPRKRCSACGEEKVAAKFNKRTRSKDGLQAWCRECERIAHRDQYAASPETALKQGRRWRAANPDRVREIDRLGYAKNPAARRESSRQWRLRNPDKVYEQRKVWQARNAEHIREQRRIRYQTDPETARDRVRQRRDRQRSNGAAEEFTRREIGHRDGWICAICLEPIDQELSWPHTQSPSLDHIVPLVQGGSHTRSNSQIAHLGCNARKGARQMPRRLEKEFSRKLRGLLASTAAAAAGDRRPGRGVGADQHGRRGRSVLQDRPAGDLVLGALDLDLSPGSDGPPLVFYIADHVAIFCN